MNLSRTTFVVFICRIGSAALRFASLALFIRLLGSAHYGSFILFETVVLSASVVVSFGLDRAVEKRASEDLPTPALISSTLLLKTATLSLFVVAVTALSETINGYLGTDLALLLIPAMTFREIGRVFLHTIRGEHRVEEAIFVKFCGNIAIVALGVALVDTGFGVRGVVLGFVGGWAGITLVGAVRTATPVVRWPRFDTVRSLFSFSKYQFVTSIFGQSYSWLDTLIIGLFLSPTLVTAYETAWRLAGVGMLLSQSIATAMFPQISQWDEQGHFEKIERVIPDALTGALVLVIPAIPGFIVYGDEILSIVFSPSTAVAAGVLVILAVGKIPEGLNDVSGRVLLAMDRPDLPAISTVVFVVANLGLNLALTPRFGIFGAAVATVTAFMINCLMNVWYIRKLVTIRVPWLDLSVVAFAATLMYVAISILSSVRSPSSLIPLLASVGIGAVLYLIVLLFSSNFRNRIQILIHSLYV